MLLQPKGPGEVIDPANGAEEQSGHVALAKAVERMLEGVSGTELQRAVTKMCRRYREGYGAPTDTLTYLDALAYAAFRLPSTYAASLAVLSETAKLLPDFQPSSVLDAGAGPGTAGWAAKAVWPSISDVTLLERDSSMVRLGRTLRDAWEREADLEVTWERTDITSKWDSPKADVTVAAYVLGELEPERRNVVTENLWHHCQGICVMVEPGTPKGYETVKEASQRLSAEGARTIAPVPSDWGSLDSPEDWIHFSVRVPRSAIHRWVKSAQLSYEDEKYSYVVASRIVAVPYWGRVMRHPIIKPGHIRLTLGTCEGVKQPVISRSQAEAYRIAKRFRWGDSVSFEEASLLGVQG